MTEPQDQMRLQRYLSLAGHCSRRKAEELITQGRVTVNGRVVNTLGAKVDPSRARVKVDDKPVKLQAERVYILLHKPPGYITTLDDPADRPIITDLLPKGMPRVYPAGRLDWDSEGALFLTNDGDLAHAITHPSRKVTRVYEVKLKGELSDEGPVMKRLREGVDLDDGFMKPDRVSMLRFTGRHTWLEFHIHEGRNRILRRLCDAIGHPVLKLRRTSIGPIQLSTLPLGAFRNLTSREVFELYDAVGLNPITRPPEAGRADLEPVQLYQPTRGPRVDSNAPARPSGAGTPGASSASRPTAGKPIASKPAAGKPAAGRPSAGKPAAGKPAAGRPSAGRPAGEKPSRPRVDKPAGEKPSRPRADKPVGEKPSRPRADKPVGEKPSRPRADKPPGARPKASQPARPPRPPRDGKPPRRPAKPKP